MEGQAADQVAVALEHPLAVAEEGVPQPHGVVGGAGAEDAGAGLRAAAGGGEGPVIGRARSAQVVRAT